MTDQEIVCADCNTPFPFTVSEQEFFAEKQFSPPKRCRACRQAKKDKQGGGDRPQRQGSGSSGGTGRSGGTREMFDAICATCNKETQVPFKPNPDRPVYCRDCFRR